MVTLKNIGLLEGVKRGHFQIGCLTYVEDVFTMVNSCGATFFWVWGFFRRQPQSTREAKNTMETHTTHPHCPHANANTEGGHLGKEMEGGKRGHPQIGTTNAGRVE
jgi:hypothetical protein